MEDNNKKLPSTSINWFPGHMSKTRKQIIDDLKLIDVVIEILDARIPISSRNPDIEHFIENKKKIFVLNKADLADSNVTNKWIQGFKKQGIIAVPVEANSGKGIKDVVAEVKKQYAEQEEKFAQKGRIGRKAKAMIIGIPNVGKSTFINSLVGKSKTKVGNRPGVTVEKQWITIDSDVELLDTPGMLWPKLDDKGVSLHLAYINSIGQNAVDNEEIAYFLLKYLVENYKKNVETRYEIEIGDYDEIIDIRDTIARKKGCILSGGRINEQKISDMILNDFRSGKLGRISLEIPENK